MRTSTCLRPNAPSFIAVDKRNGKVLWTDNSPGPNVLHGQWSSPAYAVIDDVPQVIFAGGDGWLYSFDARGENGKSKLLWKFDCNPKESKYTLGGRADRNHMIATPVIYNNLVYRRRGRRSGARRRRRATCGASIRPSAAM